MNSARASASAVLVPDGRIVFAGGNDASGQPTASTEAMASDGTFSTLPSMSAARSGHAAVLTLTGDLLVTGGNTSGGGYLNTAEVFDSLANTWTPLQAQMVDSRAGHTLSQLSDGNVLVVGGQNSSGPVSAVEIYDIGTNSFRFGGTLITARTQHAAAVLSDGRVLIIGGADANGATLASTEIYDPTSGSITAGPNLLVPRKHATATTLLDGRVVVIGGSYPEGAQNGVAELASAEIFDPATGSFALSASQLSTARAGHLAFLLPNNSNVLIAGGTSAGSDLASAEIYTPWTDSFHQTASMSATRSAAAGSALGDGRNFGVDGRVVVGGGNNLSSADMYGFAWVKTDYTDYAPGTPVVITGGGWVPNETVVLTFQENPQIDTPPPITVTADANGNIYNNQFSPDDQDAGVTFFLTATGSVSQAMTSFADAAKIGSVTASPTNPPGINPGNQQVYQVTVFRAGTTGSNGAFTATITVSGLPSGATAAPLGINFQNSDLQESGNLVISTTSAVAAGTYPLTITATNAAVAGDIKTTSVTLTINNVATNLAVATATGTYGGTTNLSATLTKVSGGTGIPNEQVTFKLNGNSVGSATTNANGVATVSNVSLAGINAGTYPTGVAANFAGDSNNQPSSGTAQLTVNQAPASVTPNPASKVYGQTDPPLTGTLTGFLPADNVTATYSRTQGETVAGSPYTISATLSPTGVLSNYNITYNTAHFTITPAAASVTPNPATKVYGTQDPTLTGTLSGFLPADNVTATYSRTAGETVAGSPYTISATLSPSGVLGNYNITYNTANFTITPAPASVTPNAATKVYGQQDPTLTGTLTGFLPADNVAATYSRTPGETVAGSPYTISATLSPTGVLSNYNITYNTAHFTITPAAASVTPNPATKVYGTQDPTLTGTLSGFLPADNVTATYSRTPGETVAGSPYTISATLSPNGVLSNYNITYNTANFTITPAPASVTPNAATKVYGQQDPTLTGTLTGFLASDHVTATYSRTPGETVAGSPYTISATLSPTIVLGNYNITYNTANFTITPAPASVTPNAATKVYGQPDPTLTGTLTGFLASDNVTATYTRTAGETVLGSPYTISATLAPAGVLGNYNITYNTANFTITPAPASVTPNSATKVYGQPDPQLTGTLSGFLAADNVTATYSRAPGESVAGSPYTITATLSPTGVLSNYAITYNTASFTITPAPASVTPNPATKVYGQPDPPLTGTLSGFLAADNVTATYSRTQGETVAGSPYTITATLSPTGVLSNYTITYNTAHFTITPATASVTPNPASKVYGQTDPTLTGTLTGFVPSDNVTATYSRTPGESVAGSPYTISATLSPSNVLGNYNITYNTANFVITAAPASVTPNPATKVYGQTDPTLTGVLSGFLASDHVVATYSRTPGESVAGSPYTISATLSPTNVLGNYSITYNTANFTITPATLTITANSTTKIYGATLTFTGHEFTTSGLVNGDTVTSVTLTSAGAPANAGVGTYPIVPSAAQGTGLSNYNINYVNGTLTVKYSTGPCLGDLGHNILQPINPDGSSVFKQGSTVPAKFRVCDANGNSVGTPGLVTSFTLYAINSGGGGLNEQVDSTNPDTQFRWDPTAMQWIFNMSTRGLPAGSRYTFQIVLNDNSTIYFTYGLK